MLVMGLTGSIGMGKSTVSSMLRRLRIPVWEADAAVHRLMRPAGRAYPQVAAGFPSCIAHGCVDRVRLGNLVFGDPAALARLEGILHPMVASDRRDFLRRCRRWRVRVAVLDIPLLFEKRLEDEVDMVLTVSAPAPLQRLRVLQRPGMSEARLAGILAKQMPDAEKRRRSDFVILTGRSRAATFRSLQTVLAALDSSHA